LPRHRNIQWSRSKAIALAVTGALTVAAAASAAAATWPQGSPGSPAPRAHDAPAGTGIGAGLTVTDRMIQARAAAGTAANQALRAYQVRAAQAELSAARRTAAREQAARAAKAAAARAAAQAAAPSAGGTQPSQAAPAPAGSPQRIAEQMFGSFGWSSSQFSCLDPLWQHESGWSVTAYNAGTGAYGIPQALPGSKMAGAGPDWQTSAATQIRWGLDYIKGSYGSPCGAWDHEEATGWY
jgi:hypothetical protein